MKKRVMLTLEKEPYEEMQAIAKRMNLAQNTVSAVCDDAILGVLKIFKQAEAQGNYTVTDLITSMAEIVSSAVREEAAYEQAVGKADKSVKKRIKR